MNSKSFLEKLNDSLVDLESELQSTYSGETDHPVVLVLGLPRSGTTVLYQLIVSAFDVAYPSNLVAKFWKTPLTGFRIQEEIPAEKGLPSFDSVFGRTKGFSGPHEFSYFFHYFFNCNAETDISWDWINSDPVDWKPLGTTLEGIRNMTDKPLVMKGLWPVYFLKKFARTVGDCYVVNLRRDPVDVVFSLRKARRHHYGDEDTWWSMKPPNYDQIKDKNGLNQIIHQTAFLEKFYEDQLSSYTEHYIYNLTYKELCNAPDSILYDLKQFIPSLEFSEQTIELETLDLEFRDYRNQTDYQQVKNQLERIRTKHVI